MVDSAATHEAFAEMIRVAECERVPLGGRTSMGAPYSEATHLIVRGIHHCERIRVGDFVLFEGGGGWVAHRIIWVLPGSRYVTKGDANLAFDRPYPSRDRLLGKVVGYVTNDLDHDLGQAWPHVLKGLWLWGVRAFQMHVLRKNIRVEDLAGP